MRELIIDKLVILYEQRQFDLTQLHVWQTEAALHVRSGLSPQQDLTNGRHP